MRITLDAVFQEIQQVKSELHRVRRMLEYEGELTDEALRDVQGAREQMGRGEYVTHEDVVAKYG